MNAQLWREPGVVSTAAALTLFAGGAVYYLSSRRRPTAEEIERERRDFLLRAGRIIDGTVVDIDEPSDVEGGAARCVFYKYEIAGVAYESSQDVTALAGAMAESTSSPGFPASVRYDPHNPMNSIVIAESWNGLRHSARVIALLKSDAV